MVGDKNVIGVEIGATQLQVVIGTPQGAIGERFRFEVDPARGAAAIREHVRQTMADLCARQAPWRVGVQ